MKTSSLESRSEIEIDSILSSLQCLARIYSHSSASFGTGMQIYLLKRSNRFWKMSMTMQIFWRRQIRMVLLGEPQSAVQDRIWFSLRVAG